MYQTSRQVAAQRQIHAAILHFKQDELECVITLCSAAEGQIPEPENPTHLLYILKQATSQLPKDRHKDDFNFAATWMKHCTGPDEIEFDEWLGKMWLNRAISKYCAVYGVGTPEMSKFFPWTGQAKS